MTGPATSMNDGIYWQHFMQSWIFSSGCKEILEKEKMKLQQEISYMNQPVW